MRLESGRDGLDPGANVLHLRCDVDVKCNGRTRSDRH